MICHPELVSGSSHSKTLGSTQKEKVVVSSMGQMLNQVQHDKKKKAAFTLAEVLITLGIIGVVAAMTLPTLIQNHRKHEVETKLAKIYSVVNQAIKLSTVEYGEPQYWSDWDCGKFGTPTCTIDEAVDRFNKYIGKHLQILKIDKDEDDNSFYVYIKDGGILKVNTCLYDIVFLINEKARTDYKRGVNSFSFRFQPVVAEAWQNSTPEGLAKIERSIGTIFEPYVYGWDGTMDNLTDTSKNYACGGDKGINTYCTKLIQLNGWKIPKDYPLKF
ncbi:MAG: type II secretion system protein [Candidatus Gastranaerophilaceae bacterium]|nr:type II secretion system protein [Candidatus Gastranaerophilaceae bacterium]